MYCSNCGSKNKASSDYCTNCGKELAETQSDNNVKKHPQIYNVWFLSSVLCFLGWLFLIGFIFSGIFNSGSLHIVFWSASIIFAYVDLRGFEEKIWMTKPILWVVGFVFLYIIIYPMYILKRIGYIKQKQFEEFLRSEKGITPENGIYKIKNKEMLEKYVSEFNDENSGRKIFANGVINNFDNIKIG